VPLPPGKFIVGISKGRTGHPLNTALVRVLAYWWAAMNFSSEWFLNYAQIFGQPMRWATYDPNLSTADQAKLEDMLENILRDPTGYVVPVEKLEMESSNCSTNCYHPSRVHHGTDANIDQSSRPLSSLSTDGFGEGGPTTDH
jgi:phage gp29-like protein